MLSLLLWRHSRSEKERVQYLLPLTGCALLRQVDLHGFQSVLFASLRSLLQKERALS